jgi:hypothetical protein
MIAYNTNWLDALRVKTTASTWHTQGLLSDEKWQAIQEHYPANFYSPNVFVRIGLAIFTLILLVAAAGLMAILIEPSSEFGFAAFSLFWALICVLMLEFRIIQGRHFKSGIDDMLLYVAIGAALTGLCSNLPYNTHLLVYYGIALPFFLAGSIRYLDRLLAAATFFCALGIVLMTCAEFPQIALYILPFVGMLCASGVYVFAKKGQGRYAWRHWHDQLFVLELLALVVFYASGNYWMVQQASEGLFQIEQVPLGWFFWTFTFLVPLTYIFLGVRKQDRPMLDIGLLCVAGAVFAFRYYHHVMPLAWAAVLSGALLFALSYVSIQYLRKHVGIYTYETDSGTNFLQEIEQQLIEQTIVNQPSVAPDKRESFGGGQFGGSGAGDSF